MIGVDVKLPPIIAGEMVARRLTYKGTASTLNGVTMYHMIGGSSLGYDFRISKYVFRPA